MEVIGFISRKRLIVLGFFFSLFLFAILFSYARHMLTSQDNDSTPGIPVERGSILDRNGKILAVQTTLYNIAITRTAVTDKEMCANLLSPVTGMTGSDILANLNE